MATIKIQKQKLDKFGVPKSVHYALILSLIPMLALGIAHNHTTNLLAPALGLLPAGLGAVLALYRIGFFRVKKSTGDDYQITLDDEDEPPKRTISLERIILAVLDVSLLASLIVTIVFSLKINGIRCEFRSEWVPKYNDSAKVSTCYVNGNPMLATYGTFPLLIDACIHGYLLIHFCYHLAISCSDKKKEGLPICARCQLPIKDGGKQHAQQEEYIVPDVGSMA